MLIEVQEEGRTLTFFLSGDVDHHGVQQIRAAMDARIREARPVTVVMELSQTQFMDSSGLGLILGRARTCETLGANLMLKNASARVKLMLDMAGARQYLQYA